MKERKERGILLAFFNWGSIIVGAFKNLYEKINFVGFAFDACGLWAEDGNGSG